MRLHTHTQAIKLIGYSHDAKNGCAKIIYKNKRDHYQYLYAVYEGDKVTWLTLIDQTDLYDAKKYSRRI